MPKADFVRVDPYIRKIEPAEREEASVGAVEHLQLVFHFEVVFFLVAGVKVSLENWGFRFVAESLDETCVIELVKYFLADAFKRAHVRIQKDDADTAIVGEVSEHINKAQVRKHRENTNFPCVFDNFGRTTPAEHVKLVCVNLYEKEWSASTIGTEKFLIKPSLEKSGWVNNVL